MVCALRVYIRHLALCEQSEIIKGTTQTAKEMLKTLGDNTEVNSFKEVNTNKSLYDWGEENQLKIESSYLRRVLNYDICKEIYLDDINFKQLRKLRGFGHSAEVELKHLLKKQGIIKK